MISDTRASLTATESPRTLEIALENGGTASLSVFEELGRGASCIAYRAIVRGDGIDAGKTCVVKEFFPLGADVRGVRRSQEGLEIPEAERAAFERRERRFRHGSKALLDYFEDDNGHHALPLMDFGRAMRTSYAIAYLGSDHLLATDPPKSIHGMAQVMKSICCALEVLHTHVGSDGTTDPQLYLDCKPSNLFWYEADGSLHARLFDFDTVVSLASLKAGICEYASYSPSWASPEQTAWAMGWEDAAPPTEAADVWAVGAVFFWLLVGHAPTWRRDLGSTNDVEVIARGTYPWERRLRSGLRLENPDMMLPLIDEITRKTLAEDPRGRCASLRVLESDFDRLASLTARDETTIGVMGERFDGVDERLDYLIHTVTPTSPSEMLKQTLMESAKAHFALYRECPLSWAELSEVARRLAELAGDYDRRRLLKDIGLVSDDDKLLLVKKTVTLKDGSEVFARLLDYCHDMRADGGEAGLTFGFCQPVAKREMNVTKTNEGGWEASRTRHWLNGDFIDELPDDLIASVIPVQKLTNNRGQTRSMADVTETTERFWLFSATELFGPWNASEKWPNSVECPDYDRLVSIEGHQYRLFRQLDVHDPYGFHDPTKSSLVPVIALRGTRAESYWVRSPDPDNSSNFAIVEDEGNIYNGVGATGLYYIVPGFCL